MKHLLLLFFAFSLPLVGCAEAPETADPVEPDGEVEEMALVSVDGVAYVPYGESIDVKGDLVALDPVALTQDLAAYDGTRVRVEGTVAKVCQAKGCWLTLQNETGEPVRVEVPRDAEGAYVYTFPTDLGTTDVIIEGVVTADTTSVETLRHFAEDEGRPADEIEAITEPEQTVVLTAAGALVKVAQP